MIIRTRYVSAVLFLLVCASSVAAQRLDSLPVRMEQREINVGGGTVTYGLLIPKTPAPPSGYPLILALHYATSQDPGLSPYFGLGYVGQIVLPGLGDLNAIIIAPDAPEATWSHLNSERAVLAIVEQVRKEFTIDNRRTLVTGFSMGGHGAWFFAANHPTLFRAAIPMASMPVTTRAATNKEARAAADSLESDVAWTKALAGVPIYVIHSRADTTVPFPPLERAVKILESNGGRVTLSAIDDVPHAMLNGYIEPLSKAVEWVRGVWGR
jgi:predicted peptidase